MRSAGRPFGGLLGVLVLVSAFAVFSVGGAAASDDEGMDVTESLVEIVVEDRFQVDDLVGAGIDLAEYLRENDDGTITLQAYLTDAERAALASQGYEFGATIEDYSTWLERKAERAVAMAAEEAAHDLAEGTGAAAHSPNEGFGLAFATPVPLPPDELTVQRADYFENYAGRFLSVEAKTLLGTPTGGPTLAVSWRTETGAYGTATTVSKYNDTDPTPDVYMYHRQLIRIGAAGSVGDIPAYVRVAASNGTVAERRVETWMGGGLPPLADGFLSDFHTSYMDPTQVYARFQSLAAEFPEISDLIDLPYETPGYQRQASATMAGTYNPASTSAPSTAQQGQAVVLWSNAMGHEGGNQLRAQFRNPGVANSPLTVSVIPGNPLGGSDIVVDLATSSTGALASTAAQVRDAINAAPAASSLVTATLWATNAGSGIVPARALVALSDYLAAPAYVQRGPFQPQLMRIGKVRDGSKVGVYLFCQQHAREWVTPITCLETAERLLRNYAIDPLTKELVDNLDIFIVPSINPDGAHTSLYDFQSKRRNMANYCAPNATASMPSGRNSIGVDLNRNHTEGSIFDGYFGASSSCTSDVYSGPFEESEPETKNLNWVADTFTNIKFSNNIHTSGGYFMWAPGAYTGAGRVTLPAPNIGVEAYFFKAADTILNRIKEWRGTVVLPQRTGPIADVLYSAAGNGADQQYYKNDIIAYSFEAGADRFTSTTTGTGQSGVGFFPNYANEGKHEANEFANGNYGLLEAALEYARDAEAPQTTMSPNGGAWQTPITTTFEWINEPSVIYYTTDGSTPTESSPQWNRQGVRQQGQRFQISETTTFKWFAKDIKGNTSQVQTARFSIDTTAPTIDLDVPADGGQYVLDEPYEVDFSCDDDDAGIVRCEGTQDDGDALDTSSIGFKTFTVEAEDAAGNTFSVTHTYNVHWPFGGMNPPFGVRNEVQAGSAFPVKFSLGGDRGLGVFVAGFPKSKVCGAHDSTLASTTTSEPFSYADGLYSYVWKTQPAWRNSCRELVLRFVDNTEQRATFEFKK